MIQKDPSALLLNQVSVNYEKTPILWDISFQIPPGLLVAIVGPNGAGKSTLLKTALGLIKPLSGRVAFFGQSLKKVRRRVAYVPQRETVDWDFPITVSELVLMGRYGKQGILRRPSQVDYQDVGRYLALVGLEECGDRQISQLSGGQQQRAFLARALIQEADLYLMDEPFAGMDVASIKIIISVLRTLREQGKTLLVVHHDLESVSTIFDWVILLNMRLIGCGAVEELFTPELLQKTYGKEAVLFDTASRLCQKRSEGVAVT